MVGARRGAGGGGRERKKRKEGRRKNRGKEGRKEYSGQYHARLNSGQKSTKQAMKKTLILKDVIHNKKYIGYECLGVIQYT